MSLCTTCTTKGNSCSLLRSDKASFKPRYVEIPRLRTKRKNKRNTRNWPLLSADKSKTREVCVLPFCHNLEDKDLIELLIGQCQDGSIALISFDLDP